MESAELLLLLHPFIPFVTEELWSLAKFDKFFKTPLISYTSKNSFVLSKNQIKNAKNINVVINFITEIRSIKVTLGISPGSFCNVFLNNTSKNLRRRIESWTSSILFTQNGRGNIVALGEN